MTASIVISTIDGREELLERSLWCYMMQTLKPEVIVVADRPKTRDTEKLVQSYQAKHLDIKYFELSGPEGWRNGYGQNKGIHEAPGDVIICTHPEVMLEHGAVQATVDRLDGEDNVCAMLMWVWLTPGINGWLKATDDWREDMLYLRELVTRAGYGRQVEKCGFRHLYEFVRQYQKALEVAPDTSPTFWQSAAMTKKTWLRIGGFTLMHSWGSMDRDFLKRKEILGIPTRIVRAWSYHQWHPEGPVDNVFEEFEYNKPEDAIRELRWE